MIHPADRVTISVLRDPLSTDETRVRVAGTIKRTWDKPAGDPYLTVLTDDGRTFVRHGSAVLPVITEELAAYLTAKEEYENLVAKWGRDMTPGGPVPAAIKAAEARVNALKTAGGEGGPGDAPCCREYGKLHEPVFSLLGCPWYEFTSQTAGQETARS
jgi:hypothetical protein